MTRRYTAAHNLGWYRYVEHATAGTDGEARGDLIPCAEVVFPFDPALQRAAEQGRTDLTSLPVERREGGGEVEEVYTIHASGLVTVRLTDLSTGYRQGHDLAPRLGSS